MTQAPKTRRTFSEPSDELAYLADKIEYWLYERGNVAAAERFGPRFEALLQTNSRRLQGSIIYSVWSALLYDLQDDMAREIKSREELVHLLRRLLEIDGPVGGFEWIDLIEELEVLAALYEDAGDLPRAEATAAAAEQLAAQRASGRPRERQGALVADVVPA